MSDTLPDVEGALRTWLRGQAAITALVGNRVFFGVPKSAAETSFPMVTIMRVGGGDDPGEYPVESALIQFDAWGSIDSSGNGDKAGCTTLVNTLRSVLRSVRTVTPLSAAGTVFGINVLSSLWLPDPESDRPRYAVTAEVTALIT